MTNQQNIDDSSMKKDTEKISHENLDLEDILCPRCEFRVSSGFKDRVVSEARSIRKRRRHRWIPYLTPSVATAAVAIVVMTALHFSKTGTTAETPNITEEIEKKTPVKSDNLPAIPELLADAPLATPEKETGSNPGTKKKVQSQKA